MRIGHDPLVANKELSHEDEGYREQGLKETEVVVEVEHESWQEEKQVHLHTDSDAVDD